MRRQHHRVHVRSSNGGSPIQCVLNPMSGCKFCTCLLVSGRNGHQPRMRTISQSFGSHASHLATTHNRNTYMTRNVFIHEQRPFQGLIEPIE